MGLFDNYIQEIRTFLEQKKAEGRVTQSIHHGLTNWPLSKNRNLVLGQDTAVELGNPKTASTSFLLWGNIKDGMKNQQITLVGPDLEQVKEKQISFGKIVLIGGDDFNEDNNYDRYRELSQVRYDIHLKGYMMRGASQFQREWSRVSKEAVKNGFSFNVLGGALMDKFLQLSFVRSVEVIFLTSGKKDVRQMSRISDNTMKIIGAMNKMAGEMSFDCDACEYTDVCSDVAELRSMRKSNKNKGAATHA